MRAWLVASLLLSIVAGCATPPPAPVPEPPPAPREEPPPTPPPAPPPCPCDEPNREISRLRHELANKEAELRDLKAQHRDQLKAMQESSRRAARAMVKAHRTATRAEAAAYLGEVEVALETTRSSTDASNLSLIAVAEGMLRSASESFKRADYGAAMDRAARAQQLIAMLADRRARVATRSPASAEVAFPMPISLRLKSDSHLRREPRGNAKVVAVLKESTALTALAYKGNWLRVEADNGRSGWMYEGVFAWQ